MSSSFLKKAFVVAILVTIFSAPAAIAFPPQCDEVCTCSSPCEAPCYVGAHFRSTCGEEFLCEAICFTAAPILGSEDTKEAFLTSLAEEVTASNSATEAAATPAH